jgi:hypothetical protein
MVREDTPMAGVATMDDVDAVREEMHREVDGLRQKLAEIQRLVRPVGETARPRRSYEQRMEDLRKMREVREMILRERSGELLPSSADEIARMREERTAHLLGEVAE